MRWRRNFLRAACCKMISARIDFHVHCCPKSPPVPVIWEAAISTQPSSSTFKFTRRQRIKQRRGPISPWNDWKTRSIISNRISPNESQWYGACGAKKAPEDALPAVKMKSANLSRAPGSLMTLQIAANFAVSANRRRYSAEAARPTLVYFAHEKLLVCQVAFSAAFVDFSTAFCVLPTPLWFLCCFCATFSHIDKRWTTHIIK